MGAPEAPGPPARSSAAVPPHDAASGAAREWLERERRRADPPAFASVDKSKTARPPESEKEKERKTDLRVWSALVLFGSFVVRPITGWWPELVIGLLALVAYQYVVRRHRAYRKRQRADRADASEGGGSL